MTEEADEIGVFETSISDDPRYSAVFEDDGEVAYGYMLIDKKIVSDVWLYNSGETPVVSPWLDGPEAMPFLNPGDFVATTSFPPVRDSSEIAFNWIYRGDRTPFAVEFWIRGKLHAWVTTESTPGWCVLAIKDGPLARKPD